MSNKILLNPFKEFPLFSPPPPFRAFQIFSSSYLHFPPEKHSFPSCCVEMDAGAAWESFPKKMGCSLLAEHLQGVGGRALLDVRGTHWANRWALAHRPVIFGPGGLNVLKNNFELVANL